MSELPIEKCVDEEIREEMRDGGFPFARLITLKSQDVERWVSPDCSLEMFAYLERSAKREEDGDRVDTGDAGA